MGSFQEEAKETQEKKSLVWVNGPIIVGGGPSGLAVSACLKENKIPSLILERSDCIASLWQNKTYDRLKLHSPKNFSELPLFGYPENYPYYPTKHQFISYLENYAQHFEIQPKFNQVVESAELDQESGVWRVQTQDCDYFSRWLVAATGENSDPFWPEIRGIESFEGPVLHTSEYRSGSEFKNNKVLVVGCGNSGMEVSFDLCNHNATPHMVIRNSVHVLPREMFGLSTIEIALTLLKWLPLRLVNMFLLLFSYFTLGNTDKLGIRRPKTGPLELKSTAGKMLVPVLDVGAISEIRSGKIKVMEGVTEITKNGAKFVDGQEREFDSIVLATGYKCNVTSWLKGSDFFGENGIPKTPFPNGWKGEKGLYAVGLSRRGLLGVASDAVKIASDIANQWTTIKDCDDISSKSC